MSQAEEPVEAGRGARRRQALHEQRLQQEALRWWLKPGVLLFLAVLILAGTGWGLLIRATRRLPVREATIDGMSLRISDATWIADQMEHGANFQQPAAMMPDMPTAGKQRVTVYLALHNQTGQTREFHGEEFQVVPEIGDDVPPFGALVGEAPLAPGQTLNTALHFDVETSRPHGKLLMNWQRGRRSVFFALPDPPEHFHRRPRGGDVALPPQARLLLPIANPDRGEQLYNATYGCSACHGDPRQPGSNNLGPHLGGIAVEAGKRVQGLPAEQYIYESILQPDAFIAPGCKGGPCQSPSAMPEYESLVNLQDAADLLGYLLEQKATISTANDRKGP